MVSSPGCLKDRIIFIRHADRRWRGELGHRPAPVLQMEDAKKDIQLYINSPGGVVTGGMAIYDAMNFLQCDIATYCIGQAASMPRTACRRDEGQALLPCPTAA